MYRLTRFSGLPAESLAKVGCWLARRSFSTGGLLVACCLLLVGCYSKEQAGKNIFHYNEQTGIASLDPAFAKNQSIMWTVHQLYNTLVEIDKDLNIIPSIAKSWEISDDRRTYTFHLRSDIFFHDDS